MNLTLTELNKVARYRRLGQTFAQISKLLHRRKSTVLTDWHIWRGTTPKRHEWTRFYAGPPHIPAGTMWKFEHYTHKEVGKIRRKAYPDWRWQYWIDGLWENDEGERARAVSYSDYHDGPFQRRLMRQEAIERGPKIDARYTFKWRLIRTYKVGYNLLHLVKRASSKTSTS